MPEYNPWDTEDLVPIENAEVTIIDSFFEEGKFGTQLALIMHIDVPHDPVDFPGESTTAWYSVGKGWQILDNGMRIVKPGSETPKIHASSNYGRFINRVVKDLGTDMRNRGNPTQAQVWKNMRFHMIRETIIYEDLPPREGETEGKKSTEAKILLPLQVLPALGSVIPQAATPSPQITTSSSASNGVAADSPEAYLLTIIAGKGSIVEAKTAAMRDPVVANNEALTAKILSANLIEGWLDQGIITMDNGRISVPVS